MYPKWISGAHMANTIRHVWECEQCGWEWIPKKEGVVPKDTALMPIEEMESVPAKTV